MLHNVFRSCVVESRRVEMSRTALITHISFQNVMETLGLEAGLELQIRWAELDLDCNGHLP